MREIAVKTYEYNFPIVQHTDKYKTYLEPVGLQLYIAYVTYLVGLFSKIIQRIPIFRHFHDKI